MDQLGLTEALRREADALGLGLELVAPAGLSLPAEVEVAAFRIGQQALANVAAHAGVARARLTVAEEDGEVVVEVVDRGRGLLQSTVGGIGVSSMRERAEELDGSCAIGSGPGGGTRVVARLPSRLGAVAP